jgi:hypothetical protein
LQGQNQLPKVIGGVRFQDGIEVIEASSNHAAGIAVAIIAAVNGLGSQVKATFGSFFQAS